MRTPESDSGDSTGAEGAGGSDSAGFGTLAEGFDSSSSDDPGGSSDGDSAFGTGWRIDADDESYAAAPDDPAQADEEEGLGFQQDEALDLQQNELSAFEFETDDLTGTGTGGDINGDGVVDGADLHESATSPFEFQDTDFLPSGLLGLGPSLEGSDDDE
jgi:hypothetical protein